MKVAITGASGYVGTAITAGFLRHGHEVLALGRRPCAVSLTPYSLGDDPQLLPWENIEVLVHAAYDFTAQTWQEILDRNVNPSVALLQAAHQAEVGRLVFISSMSSFEGCRSNYGKAKLLVEKEALTLGAVVIRPGLVWGEHSGGIMGTLEKLVAQFPIVPFLSGGRNSNQYLIHEADLAETIVAVAESSPTATGTLRTLAHPTPVPLLTILKSIAKRTHRSRLYVPIPWPLAMAGLKSLESCGLRPLFRSDSLTGLIHGNPQPEFTPSTVTAYCRPFC